MTTPPATAVRSRTPRAPQGAPADVRDRLEHRLLAHLELVLGDRTVAASITADTLARARARAADGELAATTEPELLRAAHQIVADRVPAAASATQRLTHTDDVTTALEALPRTWLAALDLTGRLGLADRAAARALSTTARTVRSSRELATRRLADVLSRAPDDVAHVLRMTLPAVPTAPAASTVTRLGLGHRLPGDLAWLTAAVLVATVAASLPAVRAGLTPSGQPSVQVVVAEPIDAPHSPGALAARSEPERLPIELPAAVTDAATRQDELAEEAPDPVEEQPEPEQEPVDETPTEQPEDDTSQDEQPPPEDDGPTNPLDLLPDPTGDEV